MITLIKKLFTAPTPLEMAAQELVEAQREKLRAETAREYAEHIVYYNAARIERLRERLTELKGEQA